jgi:hypothetical protein
MVLQAQAVRHVALAMTVPCVMHVRRVTTDMPVARAQRAMTVRPAMTVRHVMTAVHAPPVMTAPPARTARIEPLGTNTPSAMVVPFAKAATWTPRASSTVPFVRHAMSDVTYVPRVMIVRHAMTASPVDRAPCATTVRRARIAPIVPSVPLVTIVRHATTAAPHVMTALLEMIASLVTTVRHVMIVRHAVTRISILRATKRRSTSPVKTSYSSVFRRWPQRPMMLMV